MFTASIESPLLSFEGSKQNGVESKSLELSSGEATRSMRLSKITEVSRFFFSSLYVRVSQEMDARIQECPEGPTGQSATSPSVLGAPLTSFVELTTRVLSESPAAAPPAYDPALEEASEAAKDRICRLRCVF